MSRTKKFVEDYNYVSDLKESSGVVSNKYKDVVEDTFTFGKLAVEKEVMPVSDFEEMIDMVPENMEAFTLEHVENLSSVRKEAKASLNDLKIEEMRKEDYEPKVRSKAA